ncbi:3-hydroxyisobutyrate dehydrogenase [Pontibacter diazotrophicus]|uniref:3-hydroxyisobutyrate dehydrogenase n=1 Tax=Pontibacter diazotrophicus TaxID=1400979 RepID=A0A3D8L5D4_9BACT|nr:NAD(P)-binding domain-containing protein [Pontibacter diazotrophicus]RDV12619.1 3-hydroxyisobutyrate dehydrogenase [Pontibacter diazotrophicus]
MKIGVIGAGVIGKTLARKFSEAGHNVTLADARGVAGIQAIANAAGVRAVEVDDVAEDVDVLVVSIPFINIPDLVKTLQGKIGDRVVIVETTNYWPHRDGKVEAVENGMVNSVWVQEQFGRPVVKAFSNIGAYSLATEGRPKGSKDRVAVAVSGDEQKSKEVVLGLVDDAGFDALDAGLLEDSWRQQACSPAYCTDLTLPELVQARASANRETLRENQELLFGKMQDIGDEYFKIILSGDYPEGFVDHAVDIVRAINNLPPRKH